MLKLLSLLISFFFYFGSIAQIPSTKSTIENFIDSIGNSNDRLNITSSVFPAITDGTNPKWTLKFWYNKNRDLLWVEDIIPDSLATVFFYCQGVLIFVSERTYRLDSISNKREAIYRKIYFDQSKIIDDSSPGSNDNTVKYYLDESKKYLDMFKTAD
jgi:hypothetical protein